MRDAFSGIGAIGEDAFDKGERPARGLKQGHSAVAVLQRGRMHLQHKRSPIRVDHGVTLAALDLFARVKAARTAAFRGLDRLTVDHGGRRTGFASDPLAVEHHELMIEALPQAVVAKANEPAIGCLVRREVFGQQPPGTAAAQHIENRVQHFAHRPHPTSPGRGGRRQKRRENPPFFVGQIAAIAQMATVVQSSGFGRPHRRLQEKVSFSIDSLRLQKFKAQPAFRDSL